MRGVGETILSNTGVMERVKKVSYEQMTMGIQKSEALNNVAFCTRPGTASHYVRGLVPVDSYDRVLRLHRGTN